MRVPRRKRTGTAGLIFHVINRGVRRLPLFDHDDDYRLWLQAFAEAHDRCSVDVFAFCLMPNHFHLILRPNEDGQLSEFMRLGTVTHSVRWHCRKGSTGTGSVYQGRYRAFPIQTNSYFYNACCYVEANPLRASLVARAQDWEWSSLAARCRNFHVLPLAEWPIVQPPDWLARVNEAGAAFDRIRQSLRTNAPLGEAAWARAAAASLNLPTGVRPRGRPRKR
jgi:putative transposase